MESSKCNVCVVGCGIIGLSTAVLIQKQNPDVAVTIIANRFSPDTTGDVAAGVWTPILPEGTPSKDEDLLRKWMAKTGKYLERLVKSKESGKAGIGLLSGYLLSNFREKIVGDLNLYIGCRKLTKTEMASLFPNYVNGWFVTSFQVECKVYLPWLLIEFKKRGGKCIKRKVNSIFELKNDYNVIVNCTGLGARELANDFSVYPARGQNMRVKAPWIKHFIKDIDTSDHIFPCLDSVYLGGTYENHNWDLKLNAETTKQILRGCSRLLPSVVDGSLEYESVGLRPSRTTVRLEKEYMTIGNNTIQVIHNYGHGGRGISLFWECALDAATLVKDALYNDNRRFNKISSKL